MKKLLGTVFLLTWMMGYAQDRLHVMLSRAPLPSWVNISEGQFLNKTIADRKAQGWQFQKDTRQALAEATAAQYSFLSSGRLLFNDEAGALANSICDKLLKNDSITRKQVNIYVYYSSGTNAIAYPNGLIIIELGLFAQLENEDQLAYIISHEIAHIKNGDYATAENPWDPEDSSPEVTKYMEYKRYREIEADLLAFELYEKAGYAPLQALRVFDVLERNWLVPTALPFHTRFFSDSVFAYPEAIYLLTDECSPGVDDSKYYQSSQEVCSIRRSKLAGYFKLDSTQSEIIPAHGEFAKVNQLAVYNCGLIALESKQYAAALYCGYYLHMSDSSLWDESDLLIGKALYLNAAFRSYTYEDNTTVTSEVVKKPEKFGNLFFWASNEEEPDDVRGYISGAKNFMEHLTNIEAMMLSVRWWWDYSNHTLRHKQLATLLANQSATMFIGHWSLPADSLGSIKITHFKSARKIHQDEEEDDLIIHKPRIREELVTKELKRKYDSLKRIQAAKIPVTDKQISAELYISNQLLIPSQDSSFRAFYTSNFTSYSSVIDSLERKPVASHLGADSVYLIGAHHVWTREYKRTYKFKVDEQQSDAKSDAIEKNINSSGKSYKIRLLTAHPASPDTLTLEGYNNYCLARRVFSEITHYEKEAFAFPVTYKEEFDSVAEATHVTHAIVDLAITKQYTKVRSPGMFIVGLLFPYTTPIALIFLMPTRKFTFRQTAVFNLQTGNTDWTWIQTDRGSGGGNQAVTYYARIFKKIKKPKRKPASQVK